MSQKKFRGRVDKKISNQKGKQPWNTEEISTDFSKANVKHVIIFFFRNKFLFYLVFCLGKNTSLLPVMA